MGSAAICQLPDGRVTSIATGLEENTSASPQKTAPEAPVPSLPRRPICICERATSRPAILMRFWKSRTVAEIPQYLRAPFSSGIEVKIGVRPIMPVPPCTSSTGPATIIRLSATALKTASRWSGIFMYSRPRALSFPANDDLRMTNYEWQQGQRIQAATLASGLPILQPFPFASFPHSDAGEIGSFDFDEEAQT